MNKLVIGLALAIAPSAFADKNYTGDSGEWDCSKDANVHIVTGSGKFTLTGACATISIEGGENTLTVESVDSLKIVGGSNVITAVTLGSVKIVGADNKISYKKAKAGDKPKFSAVGAGNKLDKLK